MWTHLKTLFSFFFLTYPLFGETTQAHKGVVDLSRASFKEILDHYTFVDDFSQKEEDRPLQIEGIFWRYPYHIPVYKFDIPKDFGDTENELPSVQGDDRAAEHYNFGRVLFREKKYDEALKAFLTARAKYGKTFASHRRADYYLALTFLKSAHIFSEKLKTGEVTDLDVKVSFGNTSTFFSWAFINKKDILDPFLDQITPKSLYTLSAIYFTFGRYSGAYSAATEGLDFLKKTGRTEYRADLYRVLIETMIQAHDYLPAIQNIDTSIRQDPEITNVTKLMSNVGDIYFDLNNYELAQDIYEISARLNELQNKIDPLRHILLGESYFWQGKFDEAQKAFFNGIESSSNPKAVGVTDNSILALAQLRLADIYLAKYEILKKKSPNEKEPQEDLLKKSKLAYFRTINRFPKEEHSRSIAKMRLACLELPYYLGNNVLHARDDLEELKTKSSLHPKAIELAWACKVGSFTSRERTQEMLERVREFAKSYPESGFLKDFEEPLKSYRREDLNKYMEKGSTLEVISFYETNKKLLFEKIENLTKQQRQKLFTSYVDNFQSDMAAPFWGDWKSAQKEGIDLIRALIFLSEVQDKNISKNDRYLLAKLIKKAETISWKKISIPQAFFTRFFPTKNIRDHLPWMTKYISEHRNKNAPDLKSICTDELPLYSKFNLEKQKKSKLVLQNFRELRNSYLEKVVALDDPCGEMFFELENSLSLETIEDKAKLWSERMKWKMTKALSKALWEASEVLYNQKKTNEAKAIWKFLSENAPERSMEKKLSSYRIAPSETQLEKLWN